MSLYYVLTHPEVFRLIDRHTPDDRAWVVLAATSRAFAAELAALRAWVREAYGDFILWQNDRDYEAARAEEDARAVLRGAPLDWARRRSELENGLFLYDRSSSPSSTSS